MGGFMKYTIIMYGLAKHFTKKSDAMDWCEDGIFGTDGCERDRFVDAYFAIKHGAMFVNTDLQ